jgi:hypothetical protein
MLEGLSENLNEAVADVVRTAVVLAVREAVQGALAEIMTNPAVLAQLRDALPPMSTPPTPVARPGNGPTVKERLSQVWSWLGAKVQAVIGTCQSALNGLCADAARAQDRVQQAGQAVWLRLRLLRHFRSQLFLALGWGWRQAWQRSWLRPGWRRY